MRHQNPTPVIFLIITLSAYSCTPELKIHISNTSYGPLPDTAECVIVGSHVRSLINGDSIGNVSSNETTGIWPDDELADWLRATARKNGANLVHITGHFHGHRGSPGRTYATLYRTKDLRQYETKIEWSAKRRLTWADFKGVADTATQSKSTCEFFDVQMLRPFRTVIAQTRTQFYCTFGWIKTTSKDSVALLAHEQGNFDLCEIYRRQLDEALRSAKANSFNRYRVWKDIFDQCYASYLDKKTEYETETGHGLDDAKQSEWANRIAGQLEKGKGHPDSFFAVDKIFTIRQKDSVAKELKPLPGKALVYVLRPRTWNTPILERVLYDPILLIGGPYFYFLNFNHYTVGYDHRTIGPVGGRKYEYRWIDPDECSFIPAMNQNDTLHTIFGNNRRKKDRKLTMPLVAGKVYYLKLTTNMGWFKFAPPLLEWVDEGEGQKLLRKCLLSKNMTERHFYLLAATDPLY